MTFFKFWIILKRDFYNLYQKWWDLISKSWLLLWNFFTFFSIILPIKSTLFSKIRLFFFKFYHLKKFLWDFLTYLFFPSRILPWKLNSRFQNKSLFLKLKLLSQILTFFLVNIYNIFTPLSFLFSKYFFLKFWVKNLRGKSQNCLLLWRFVTFLVQICSNLYKIRTFISKI